MGSNIQASVKTGKKKQEVRALWKEIFFTYNIQPSYDVI
jgi:hypothetical protein